MMPSRRAQCRERELDLVGEEIERTADEKAEDEARGRCRLPRVSPRKGVAKVMTR